MVQSRSSAATGGVTMIPAIQAKMGKWSYYITRMPMSDVADKIGMAGELHKADSLDGAIQHI